jgi:hypothetical protein
VDRWLFVSIITMASNGTRVVGGVGNSALAIKIRKQRDDLRLIIDVDHGLLSLLYSMGVLTQQQIDLVE